MVLLVAEVINEGPGEKYELSLELSDGMEGIILNRDEALIARAIWNLLNNSIRHNPGSCKILVMGSRKENSCILQITDNGCGIPEEIVKFLEEDTGIEQPDEIEQPAVIKESQSQRKPHIMGLRIVKQIVLAHNGSFQIKEEGHSVRLVLPIE